MTWYQCTILILIYTCSISHSPKGWTDQELGSAWLERDFEPETAAKVKDSGYRLLILDGHNSHTTYRFCSFAEKHKIIVLCLPSHTTHRLQPCDVGCFGPLASTWKSEVNKASSEWIPIRKNNLLLHYSKARVKALTQSTIRSAFRKTGIWPINRHIIEQDAYAPALNTTTQASQPIAAVIPDLLVPAIVAPVTSTTSCETPSDILSTPSDALSTPSDILSTPSSITASSSAQSTPSESQNEQNSDIQYVLKNLPPKLPPFASRDALANQNAELRYLLDRSCYQMQRDYALKKLMEKENGRLRKRLFDKSSKKKSKFAQGFARHMTSEESLDALAKEEWAAGMKEVFKERVFKQRRDAYEKYCRELVAEEKAREKEAERTRKDEERARKEAEMMRERARKAQERRREQEERKREKEHQKALKNAARLQKAAVAAAAKAKKRELAGTRRRAAVGRRQAAHSDVDEAEVSREPGSSEEVRDEIVVVPTRPRPKPKPMLSPVILEEAGPLRRSTRHHGTT